MQTLEKEKKVILITGASSGIGKATALKLLEEGMIVYGAARRVEKMQEIVEAGGIAIELDITNEKQIEKCVKQVIKEQGRIDILFNNAGYAVYGSVEDITIDEARRQFEVNLFGLARITQEVLPYMRNQGYGKIINTSSMGGKIFTPHGAWYHATKHALEGWTDCLRFEVAQFGIKVVIIEPGVINTSFTDVMMDPMIERAKDGPYQDLTEKVANASKAQYNKPNSASSPDVIADVVFKAIESSKPKRRYVAGKLANPMIFLRKWFGDGVYEWALKRFLN